MSKTSNIAVAVPVEDISTVDNTSVQHNASSNDIQVGRTEPSTPSFFARYKWLFIVIAVIATVVGLVVGLTSGPNCEEIVIQSHNTKQLWMDEIVQSFNKKQIKINGGDESSSEMCLKARVCHTGSGRLDDPCGDGTKSHIWSPPNFVWVARDNLENSSRPKLKDSEKCKATTKIPIGILMWRSQAVLLGWPDKDLGWKDIEQLALDPNGWYSLDSSIEWGKDFLFGHGHPDLSNSGSLSWVAAVYGWSNTSPLDQLTDDIIFQPEVQENTKNLAHAVAHMGKVDTDILDRMVKNGISYLHAVSNYESNVIRYNEILREKGSEDEFVLIYPNNGTFWQREPLCVLDGIGSDLSDFEVRAANEFLKFAIAEEQQVELVKYGIRPFHIPLADAKAKSSIDPFTFENGVIPDVTVQSIPLINDPAPEVVNSVIEMWKLNKKPVLWYLVLDVSGSMVGARLSNLKVAAKQFVSLMENHDLIKIYTFSSTVDVRLEQGTIEVRKTDAISIIDGLEAGGDTYLHTAIIDAVQDMEQFVNAQSDSNEYNYGIVVMTDGDNRDLVEASQVYDALPSGSDPRSPHIFTVGFDTNSASTKEFLTKVASDTNGKFFPTEGADLERIFIEAQAEL